MTIESTNSRVSTDDDPASLSQCHVAFLRCEPLTFWTSPETDVSVRTNVGLRAKVRTELALALAPTRLVVVGRSTGRTPVPYLDPAYRATTVLPDSDQTVLRGDEKSDIHVSRAHFTLRSAPDGAVRFTNGVPQAGGGIRPPTNGTWLMAPTFRQLEPGEEVLIPFGDSVSIQLPNHCILQLKAA